MNYIIKLLTTTTGKSHVGIVIFLVIIATAYFFVSGNPCDPNPKPGQPCQAPSSSIGIPQQISPSAEAKQTLQMKDLKFGSIDPIYHPSITPSPGQPIQVNSCPENVPDPQKINPGCVCPDRSLTCTQEIMKACFTLIDSFNLYCNGDYDAYECQLFTQRDGLDHTYCVGKPVIYLYPQTDTVTEVKLTIPGVIYKSIPSYPEEGWQNILAHPGGSLVYNNQTYHELYYESAVHSNFQPTSGFIIPMHDLENQLMTITEKLGLKKPEQEEFLAYWSPKLQQLNSNYILFSLLDKTEKERIDHVDISPQPDTFIEFLAYFKPLEYPVAIEPLQLPQTKPERIGFTAVEWGGTINTEKQLLY